MRKGTKGKRAKRGGVPGRSHGKSIKNPAVYERLRAEGMSKAKAAKISNGALQKGYRKGRHRSGKPW
jgi:hypothetical protein